MTGSRDWSQKVCSWIDDRLQHTPRKQGRALSSIILTRPCHCIPQFAIYMTSRPSSPHSSTINLFNRRLCWTLCCLPLSNDAHHLHLSLADGNGVVGAFHPSTTSSRVYAVPCGDVNRDQSVIHVSVSQSDVVLVDPPPC